MTIDPSILPHQTERLILRPFTVEDLPTFVAYRSDPEVAKYQSWSNYDMAQAKAFMAHQDGATFAHPGTWCQLALELKEGGAHIGDVVIKVLAEDPKQAEVGFTLAPEHQGRGYATEALRGLLAIAFDALGLHRVIAITDALNAPAAALLERVGFRKEAHLIENIFFKGAWGDEFQFAMLGREWRAKN